MLLFLVRLLKEPGSVLRRLFQCFFVWGQPTPKGNPKDAQLIVVQAMSDCEGMCRVKRISAWPAMP